MVSLVACGAVLNLLKNTGIKQLFISSCIIARKQKKHCHSVFISLQQYVVGQCRSRTASTTADTACYTSLRDPSHPKRQLILYGFCHSVPLSTSWKCSKNPSPHYTNIKASSALLFFPPKRINSLYFHLTARSPHGENDANHLVVLCIFTSQTAQMEPEWQLSFQSNPNICFTENCLFHLHVVKPHSLSAKK